MMPLAKEPIVESYAVFGHPIEHSLSPQIHQSFAEQTGIHHPYCKIKVPHEDFESIVSDFFTLGGLGANITTPFKERAYRLCDQHTEHAKCTGVVNTLKLLDNNQLLGDNTDGIGLLADLKRLNLLMPGDRILLIGAGGAAQGVIPSLLKEACELVITNRTLSRAQKLEELFQDLGKIKISEINTLEGSSFDLIINATTSGLFGEVPDLPACLFFKNSRCYDMFYSAQASETIFIDWIKQKGVMHYADGLGMLVAQAAYSFYLWHGVMPEITPVLSYFAV